MHLTLYHLVQSRSQRILWLLEELNLNYNLKIYQKHIYENQHDELKQLNKFAQFPTVLISENEQTSSTVLTETAAIADYLSYVTQQLGIQYLSAQEIIDFYFWKNFSESNFMPNLALKQIFSRIVQRTPFPIHYLAQFFKYAFDQGFLNKTLHQQMQMIEQQLATHTWIAGEHFTIADILLWFPLQACFELDTDFQRYSEIQRYLLQIQSRPAFQTALKKGQWSAPVFQKYWSNAY
ncbi:glutathione binding-like protein [Acinetobacter sp. P8-3-8]|uniref:glutathione binding-like protein n=1 Tax=Acinetobacter sp. P8-3-8 TaxID=1029823 RepID=UPI000248592D|nr:glutathione binding-like protein [Acinetobacter sp. P8-3-8]